MGGTGKGRVGYLLSVVIRWAVCGAESACLLTGKR